MKNILLFICFLFASASASATVAPIAGTLVFCEGSVTTLTDATPGGTWSTGGSSIAAIGSSTGIVTGITAGTADITYTVGSESAVTTVTVNASPAAITGIASTCTGASSVMADAAPGGTWMTSDPTIATIGSTSGIVTGMFAGSLIVTYTLPTGCIATRTFTVNPTPPAIVGDPHLCIGVPGSISDPAPGGIWSCSTPSVATISVTTGVVTGVSAGTATISYRVAGCNALMVVTVNPTPGPISGTTSMCVGVPGTLSNTTPGGIWASSNTAVATVGSSSGIVTGVSMGSTTITYVLSSACFSSIVVTVTGTTCSGAPSAGVATTSASAVCIGNVAALSLPGATSGCGISYQWQSSPDGSAWSNITGATTGNYNASPSAATFYRSIVTCGGSGLSATSSSVGVTVGYSIDFDTIFHDTTCNVSHFYVRLCGSSPSYSLTSWFGDGTNATTILSGDHIANVYHAYSASGTYTVKHILSYGGAPVDSSTFSYEYTLCQSLPIKLFVDVDGDGVYDSDEPLNSLPIAIKIDSNGVPIDTMVVTSGLYRDVYAPVGTVYTFRPLTTTGTTITYPSTGVFNYTISATGFCPLTYFGIAGAAVTFDIAPLVTEQCGRHSNLSTIVVANYGWYPVAPTLTMNCSPKYTTTSAYPAPTSIVGNVLTWNLGTLAGGTSVVVTVWRERSGPWLIPGDTVQSSFSVAPTTGDSDPGNNVVVRVDTVKASFDPNHIAVSPEGNILPCTKLQYAIQFENDGNDTAHNIYVLDTLSSALDAGSLEAVIASSPMNMSIITSGLYKIAKFDFPNIKLLDSSHHNQCNGMFLFNINAKPGLTDGTGIMNRVGIYFDDNPVVMTNEVNNVIGINPIVGASSLCVGDSISITDATPSGVWSTLSSGITLVTESWGRWLKGTAAGSATVSYTVTNSCTSRSATKAVTVNTVPSVAAIGGTGSICAGSSTSLSDATTGGAWSSTTGTTATVSTSGLVSAVATGTTTISYTVINTCGTSAATTVITVNPLMTPAVTATAAPGAAVCEGGVVTFTSTPVYGGSAPIYKWIKNGAVVAIAPTYTYVPADGDVIQCVLISDYACRTTDTASSSTITMEVDPMYVPVVSLSAVPGYNIGAGESVTLTASATSAGPSPSYQWFLGSVPIAGATNSTYTSSTFIDNDSVTCAVTGSGACHVVTFKSATIHVGTSVDPLDHGLALEVFPNPGTGIFSIRGHIAQGAEQVAVRVRDILGQPVYDGTSPVKNGIIDQTLTLPVTLANGVYMLELQTPGTRNVVHFVLSR